MRPRSLWDIPNVVCFLIGFVIVLVGLAATTFHVIDWVRTNQWHAYSDGDMLVSYGYGGSRGGWGTWQRAVDGFCAAPFWAVALAVGAFIIYLPSLLATVLGRR